MRYKPNSSSCDRAAWTTTKNCGPTGGERKLERRKVIVIGVTSPHEPHRLKPTRQTGFPRYAHAPACLQTLFSGLVVARAREQALQVSFYQPFESVFIYGFSWSRKVITRHVMSCCGLSSRVRFSCCHVVSRRGAPPAPDQVTSRHMPSPLVRLFAPCPPFTSHYVTSRHAMFNTSRHVAPNQVTRLSNVRGNTLAVVT